MNHFNNLAKRRSLINYKLLTFNYSAFRSM